MDLKPITRQEQIIAGKDLEPITRMEKLLKQYGGASSWNDLTDKPFGEERVEYRDIQLVSGNGSIGTDFAFAPGENYTIIWNGTEYNCTAYAVEALGGLGAVGNSRILGGEDNGMPFLLLAGNGGMLADAMKADAIVTIIGKEVIRLQEKFMPNTVPLMVEGKVPASKVESDIFVVDFPYDIETAGYVCSATPEDMYRAFYFDEKLVVAKVCEDTGSYTLLYQGGSTNIAAFGGYAYNLWRGGKAVELSYVGTTVTKNEKTIP
jgi:hypothetical protein